MTTGGATTGLAPAAGLATQRAASAHDYWELLKPRIMLLIVITTIGSLALAAHGWPGNGVAAWTVLGMALVVGRIERRSTTGTTATSMRSWRARARGPWPAAACRRSPRSASAWRCRRPAWPCSPSRCTGSPAVWAFAGFACYVLVYTVWLKRRTPQNIVIGGAAGAVPPLVAWAAVDGSVSATAVALFAIVFLWTPPHFWALALLLEEDYARAGVPMLPTVRGAQASARQILVYTLLLVAASLVPVALGTLSWLYAIAAVVLGGRFVWLALRLLRAPDDRATARRTFLYSLLYLALLFAAMGVDSALLG